MATYTKTITGRMGTVAADYSKTIKGVLGTGNADTSIQRTTAAVMGLTGSMARSMIYSETHAGVYPPLVWMDDFRGAPALVFTGSMVKGTIQTSKPSSAELGLTGSMAVVKNIGKTVTGQLVLTAGGVATTSVPSVHVKTIRGELTFTTGNASAQNPGGTGGRSLRGIHKRNRRGWW